MIPECRLVTLGVLKLQAKAALVKETIRLSHLALGDFHFGRGDLQNAFKSFVRTRDYCLTGRHIVVRSRAALARPLPLYVLGHPVSADC